MTRAEALVAPSETSIRRALPDTDPGALDEQLAAWLAAATIPDAGHLESLDIATPSSFDAETQALADPYGPRNGSGL